MLHPNGDSCGDALQAIHSVNSLVEDELRGKGNQKILLVQSIESAQVNQQKTHFCTSNRPGKRHDKYALQQVISARQHKIYEQQCEIEELRRRIRDVCSDNKFLREQNYWQAKALEKLDGKHAELPQLINGHLEEIRVFREQIKRMKEVLKQEKQRRHDAEGSKDKLLYELKHLRKLAEEQKLLERESLMKTIEKLQAEAQERERLLVNLERYAVNLEKNQRFESLRSAKTQRDMRGTCQQLLDKIRDLEQAVQEKQKIIELGNIYSKRSRAQSLSSHLEPQSTPAEPAGHQIEPVTDTNESSLNGKCTVRDRIKVFDQKRQDMERKRERIRRKRRQQNGRICLASDELDLELNKPDLFKSPVVIQNSPNRPFSARLPVDTPNADNINKQRPKSSYNLIVLPKINSKEPISSNENESGKVARPSTENKLVRFCTPKNKKVFHSQDDALFEELRRNEILARILAESQLARASDSFSSSLEALTRTSKKSSSEDNMGRKSRSQSLDRLSGKYLDEISDQQMVTTYVDEDDSPSPVQPDCVTPTNLINPSDVVETRRSVEVKGLRRNLGETQSEAIKLPPVSDVFHLLPIPNPVLKTCQPCGDHIDASFLADVSAETASSDGLAPGPEEDLLWQETPSVHLTASMGSSGMYRAANGVSVMDDNEGEESETHCISENHYDYSTAGSVERSPPVRTKNGLPILNCSTRTTTLYTMINNSANNGKAKMNPEEKSRETTNISKENKRNV
ncbi:Lebercilin protein [Fasciola gigantica]|uniref:Lebercilin protein n=1 Tax=Fasciola gigantica TaxID=46835 RepID=A0A504YTW8_FASGI|nr:Lebercilin protein [Fasciola gigantica]